MCSARCRGLWDPQEVEASVFIASLEGKHKQRKARGAPEQDKKHRRGDKRAEGCHVQ